ncbi:hypothetical protein F5146DRAFT_924244, partial [Armillaria mellea]
ANPKSDISPRTRPQGGFVIDCDTAIDWASRMFGETITKDEIGIVWELIEERVQKFGSRFPFVGPVLYEEFMIVTRTLTFHSGYLGIDPKDIPRFHEAEKEKKVRELLKDEGELFLVLIAFWC